jgi:hypothetical protein
MCKFNVDYPVDRQVMDKSTTPQKTCMHIHTNDMLTIHQVEGKLYYLAYPKGESRTKTCDAFSNGAERCTRSKFSTPPGYDELNGQNWGNIKFQDIITGAVRTYKKNGGQNLGKHASGTEISTIADLINQVSLIAQLRLARVDQWSPGHHNPGFHSHPCV